MKKIFFVLLFVFVCSFNIIAQTNYPVNLILTGSGRYSLKLEDYQNTTTMIHLVAVVSDITINNKPVKFQMSITNGTKKFTTRLNNIRNFYIDGGTTLSFTGVDLSQYFDKNNINFNGYEYNNIGSLPDGNNLLKICLIDVTTGKQISNVASLPLHAIIAKAPELREPMNNSVFENNSSSSIINFRWFEPTKNVPLPSFRFQLFECFNNNVSLYTYAESTKPIAEVVVNGSETLTFDANTVNMKFGQKYVWRVIAFDESGLQTFVNDGKSEVFAFQYKNPPLPITGLACKVVNNEFRFTWDGSPNTKYEFQYADSAATSFSNDPSVINENKYTLKSAKDDYTIKARVRGIYYNDENRKSEWSDLCYARIPKKKERNYECGKIFPDREISNQELKTEFEEGEIIESKNGDTRFEMINVTQNQNGVLSGAFYMIMDCWNEAKILCNFTDTKINTDNIMLECEYVNEVLPDYVADPEAIRKFVAETWLLGNSALTSTVIRDTLDIDQDFDYMYVDSTGRLMAALVNNDGTITSTEVVTSRSPEQCMVTDGKGDTLVINSHGEPMGVDEYRASNGNRAMLNDYHRKLDSTANFQLNFLPSDKQVYAFDYLGSGDHGIFANNEYYPKSGSYDFRYKSVKTSQTDYVKVDFSTYRGGDKENIVFKDCYGIKLKLIDDNTLAFTASNKPDTNYIYAYDKDGVRIGKLMLKTYTPKTYNLVLVSVNGEKLPNTNKLKEYLNKIYKQSVITFEISTTTLEINDLFPFKHGDKKRLSGYNEDQKRVLQAFDSQIKPDINYLFFMPDGVETDGVAGYNPFGYNFGFIYHGAGERTIAHELGHGIASLHHPFNEQSFEKGNTANLMDYNFAEELYHFQWDNIQNPPKRIFKWNFEEEGAEDVEKLAIDIAFNIKSNGWEDYAFLSPTGDAIVIPNVTNVIFNEDGSVLNFFINDVKYFGLINIEKQEFYGYLSQKSYNDLVLNHGNIYTVEFQTDFENVKFKNITLAPVDKKVVAVYKQYYNGNYLDCINQAEWINKKQSNSYIGKANINIVPEYAINKHLFGNKCVEDLDQIQGIGSDIYVNLINIPDIEKTKLIEFANYFSNLVGNKTFAFYNEQLKDILQTGAFVKETMKYFIDNKIYSKEIFEQHFQYQFSTRDFDFVFSSKDLWDGIDKDKYNLKSLSYFHKDELYQYSFADLILREKYRLSQTVLFTAISNAEQNCTAIPISMKDYYQEYVAKWKTNSAFIAWADFMAGSYDGLIKAYIGLYLSGHISGEFVIDFIKKRIGDKFVKNFFIGFGMSLAGDAGISPLIEHFFADENSKTSLTDRYKQLNIPEILSDAIVSGIQNTMKLNTAEDIAIDAFVALDVNPLLDIFSRVVIQNQKPTDKDLELISKQLINVGIAVGISGGSKGFSKLFSVFKPIIKAKFKNAKITIAYLVNKGFKKADAEKFVDLVEKAPSEQTEFFENSLKELEQKNTITYTNTLPEHNPEDYFTGTSTKENEINFIDAQNKINENQQIIENKQVVDNNKTQKTEVKNDTDAINSNETLTTENKVKENQQVVDNNKTQNTEVKNDADAINANETLTTDNKINENQQVVDNNKTQKTEVKNDADAINSNETLTTENKINENQQVVDNNKTQNLEVEKNKTNQEQINVSSVQDEMEKFGMPKDWRNNQEIVKKLYADNKKLFFKWTTLEIFDYTKTINTIDDLINFNDDFIKILRDIYLNGLPKSWGKDNNIVEKIINNKTNYDAFVNIKNKPEFQDYNVFEENVTFEYISTLQTMNEKCPESWCKNNDIINKISHNKSILDNIDILKKKNIQIDEFDVIEKISKKDISLEHIERTFTKDLKSDLEKYIKENKLSDNEIKELVGDFEHCKQYSVELLDKMFISVKSPSLKFKLQNIAVNRFVKDKSKDFGSAFAQEMIAGLVTEIFDKYVVKKYIIIEENIEVPLSSILVNKLNDPKYWENCLKNAVDNFVSTKSKNLSEQEYILFMDFCANMNVSIFDLVDGNLWTTNNLIKAITSGIIGVAKKILLDYVKNQDSLKNRKFLKWFYDLLGQISNDIINQIISDLTDLINEK